MDRLAIHAKIKSLLIDEDASLIASLTKPDVVASASSSAADASPKTLVYKFYPKFTLTPIQSSSWQIVTAMNDLVCDAINVESAGVVHTSFVLNGLCLDWNNSARVSIRPASSSGCILAASIKTKGKSYIVVKSDELDTFIGKVWYH